MDIDPCLPSKQHHQHQHQQPSEDSDEEQHSTTSRQRQQQQRENDSTPPTTRKQCRPLCNSPSPPPQNPDDLLDPTLEAINTTDPNLINHHQNRSPKRKRYSVPDSSLDKSRPSLDTLQLAHLITSIQVQQEQASAAHAEQGSSSHLTGYPPLPSYLLQSGVAEQEWKDRIDHLLNPLKLEISRLRSRIETLENERLVMAREITSLKGCFSNHPDLINPPLRPVTRSAAALQTPTSHQDHSRIFNPTSNHSFDIPVGPLPDLLQSNQANSNNLNSVAHLLSAAQNSGPKSAFPFRLPDSAPSSSSKLPPEVPFRRASRKKSEVSSLTFDTPSSTPSNNNRAKHRKPELSRTVRATVFRLMGVSSIHSPLSASANLPSDPACKFGSEKSRAYHGYTTSPCFPEYTSEELFDPITKAKLWRWDWSKTIRQSQNNTNFAKEIRNVIVKEAEDPIRPMHTDVPASDWQYLNDAIDSAYTNMRRERDNLIDPNKMVKKEVHRARNKKRGLKEDKYKRRKKALDEYRSDPHSFSQRLHDLNISKLPEAPLDSSRTDAEANGNGQGSIKENPYQWDDALDIKYMSSEDEANVNDFENPISVGIDQLPHHNNNTRTDNTLASSDKVFAICRPTWRSSQLQNFFSFLDAVKQPERAYRRVMGPSRVTTAPFGTPAWMVNQLGNQGHEEGDKEGRPDHESGQMEK